MVAILKRVSLYANFYQENTFQLVQAPNFEPFDRKE